MLQAGAPFPPVTLPSSKGGSVKLADMFPVSATVVAVIPREDRNAWLEAVAERISEWLLDQYVNVYLILDVPPEEARTLCDLHGIQAPVLCDEGSSLYPDAEGFYRVNPEGIIEAALGPDSETPGFEGLFAGWEPK
jgi:peroxiredoxin